MDSEVYQDNEQQQVVPVEQQEENHEIAKEVQDPQEKPILGPSREHFRRLEQSKKELEKELRMQREMNEMLLQQSRQITQQPVQQVDELDSIADEDFIPKGKVEALVQKRAEKIAEQVVQREQEKFLKKQHESTFLTRLKGQFSDFDDVVNPETLAILEQKNPELAQTIVESKDPYKIGLQSYNFIKAMNLHKNSDSPRSKEVEKKLVENAKTVQSPQAFSKRPMAQAFSSTEDERKALFEEMNLSARQAGFRY